MLTLILIRALSLVAYDAPPVDRAPWVADLGTVVYRTAGASAKGRQPWARESLNRSGTMPAIVAKGGI